jgi:hypothetical protein
MMAITTSSSTSVNAGRGEERRFITRLQNEKKRKTTRTRAAVLAECEPRRAPTAPKRLIRTKNVPIEKELRQQAKRRVKWHGGQPFRSTKPMKKTFCYRSCRVRKGRGSGKSPGNGVDMGCYIS